MNPSKSHMMVKMLSLCFAVAIHLTGNAQKFTSDKGEVSFTSNAALELINASSKRIQAIVDPATGQFAFVVIVRSFEGFNSSLQQKHFNDKYLETDKYYNATFAGKINEPIDFTKDGVYDVHAKGSMVIHGQKKERIIPGKLEISNGAVTITSNFDVALADHGIPIPQIVSSKIATVIFVKMNVTLTKK